MASKIKKRMKKIKRKKALTIFYIILALLLVIVFIYLISLITLNIKQRTKVFREPLNIEIAEPKTYEWQIEQEGDLQSVKVSGLLKGNGKAKVYLDDLKKI